MKTKFLHTYKLKKVHFASVRILKSSPGLYFRLHHSYSQVLSIATDRVVCVCVSVCLLVTFASLAKMA